MHFYLRSLVHQPVVLGFYAIMHQPTKFHHSWAIHGWITDVSTIFLARFSGGGGRFCSPIFSGLSGPNSVNTIRSIIDALWICFRFQMCTLLNFEMRATKTSKRQMGSKNRGQILDFLPFPRKIMGGMDKISKSFLCIPNVVSSLWYRPTFDRRRGHVPCKIIGRVKIKDSNR